LLALVGLTGCARSCGRDAPRGEAFLYASDEDRGDIVVIDPATAKVVTRIAVGKRPRGLKASRDGKLLYVALSGSPRAGPGVDESTLPPADRTADGIGVVDLAERRLVHTFQSGQDPESFDVSPDGQTLFVSNEDSGELTVLDTSNGAFRGRVQVGGEPEGVTVRPDGKVVFVTSEEEAKVAAVDTKTLQVVAKVPTGPRPRSIVTADGLTAFVTSELGAAVTMIDAAKYQAIGEIKVQADAPSAPPPRPMGAALSRDGKELYVSCGRGGSIAVIDVAAKKQVRSINAVGDRPWGIALSADGKRLFTANGPSADVSIVNIATGHVDTRIQTGGLPWGVIVGT